MSRSLFTVLRASGEEPEDLRVQRIGDNAIAISGAGDPAIVAVRDDGGRIVLPGAATIDGEMAVLTPTHLCAVGATSIEALGQTTEFAEGADIEADLAAGHARLLAPPVNSIGTQQNAETAEVGARISRAEAEGMIEALVASAPPGPAPATAGGDAPGMTEHWAYMERPDNFLLTGNPGEAASVNAVERVGATPDPLEANVFSGQIGGNVLRNIFDGRDDGTSDATMWADDQEVTIELELLDSYHIERMNLKAWFATSSSKGALFQLGRIRLLGSTDGFVADERVLVDFTDEEMHSNWGLPVHAPEVYAFDLDAAAKSLRLILTPRPGTAVYVAELSQGHRRGPERLRRRRRTRAATSSTRAHR